MAAPPTGSDSSTTPERLTRISVPELDAILGEPLTVLDDGFVRVIDYMGSDASIVQAARVSYGAGTKHVSEDRGLIRYLMRHSHSSPFEMCEIKLHVRVPMDTWRQWIRHRTANVNEYSTRYSIAIDAAQITAANEWRTQSSTSRQGSGAFLPTQSGEDLSKDEREFLKSAREIYERRIAQGVAREQARKDLPLSTYTEAYWKIDLHNLLNFLRLRMDAHAQKEIREYANLIGREIVARWCPIAWEAFVDYRMQSISLSESEQLIVAKLARAELESALKFAEEKGFISRKDGNVEIKREGFELEAKLRSLGLNPPWGD